MSKGDVENINNSINNIINKLNKINIDKKPISVDKKPISVDKKATSEDKKTISIDKKATSEDKKATIVDKKSISAVKKPIRLVKKPINNIFNSQQNNLPDYINNMLYPNSINNTKKIKQEQVSSQENKKQELNTLSNNTKDNTKDNMQDDFNGDDMWGGNIKLYNRQNLKIIKNSLKKAINSNTSINLERKVPIYNPKNQFGGGINSPQLEKICLYENKIYGKLNNGSIIKINKKNFE